MLQMNNQISIPENLYKALELFKKGKLQEAELLYSQILKTNPDNGEALHHLGLIAHRFKKANAENLLEKAIKSKEKELANYYIELGNVHCAKTKYDESVKSYEKAIELNPEYVGPYNNIGVVCSRQGDYDKSIEYYHRALKINPKHEGSYSNLGVALVEKELYEEAMNCYKKAMELSPKFVDPYYNMGCALKKLSRYDEAIHFFRKALSLNRNYSKVYLNLGIALLAKKNFDEGWKYYESRFHELNEPVPNIPNPIKWDGSSLEGKTILVCHEQGLGDTLNFVRYLPELLKLNPAKVIFKPQAGLENLIRQSGFEGIEIVENSTPDKDIKFDCYTLLLSLPHHLKAKIDEIPFPENYLKASQDKVNYYKEKYFNNDKFKIGIVWQGSQSYKNDKWRSIPADFYNYLSILDNIQVYTFQKGYGSEQISKLATLNPVNLGETFNDFTDTAAAMENIDLLITSDTSLAHLAGSLGKKVWLIASRHKEWRWFENSETSLWYNSMRIFSQSEYKNWGEVFERVIKALNEEFLNQNLSHNFMLHQNMPFKREIYDLITEGSEFFNQKKYNEALLNYQKILLLNPQYFDAYSNIGTVNSIIEKNKEGEEYFKKAIQVNPEKHEGYNSLGNLYFKLNQHEKALEYYKKAIELKPDFDQGYFNTGNALRRLERTEESIEHFKKALEVNPDHAGASLNLGFGLLLSQKWEEGWAYYEKSRFSGLKAPAPNVPNPVKWDGSSLKGKTILVCHEQGFGDTINFIRYVPELLKLNPAKVIFKPQPGIEDLLKESNFKDIEIIDNSTPDSSINFDCYSLLLSLPFHLNAKAENIPNSGKYLNANQDKVNKYKAQYFNNNKFKIGIVWQGSKTNKNDLYRSIPVEFFNYLSVFKNVQIYSLQKGYGADQISKLNQLNPINLGETFNTFSDTAAAIENLDLVITPDTSLAHLTGALGKKVWLLTSRFREWRWFKNTDRSPWYDSMKIFNQNELNNWSEVFVRVIESLNNEMLHQNLPKTFMLNNTMPFKKDIDILLQKGLKFFESKNYEQASNCYNQILLLNPHYVDAYNNLGTVNYLAKNYDEAEKYFKTALKYKPNDPGLLNDIGNALYEKELFNEAIECYKTATTLNPKYEQAYYNIGNALKALKKYDESLEFYKKSIELNPNNHKPHLNMGVSFHYKNDQFNAIKCLNNALSLIKDKNYDYYDAIYNLGCAQLSLRNFKDGWKNYESRLSKQTRTHKSIKTHKPLWNGSDLTGKTIFVMNEQGNGDSIQFFRYLSLLKEKNPKEIICKVHSGLESLLKDSDIKNIRIIDNNMPETDFFFDTYVYLLSLPYLLDAREENIPLTNKYINSDPEKAQYYKKNFFNTDKIKVGIFWQGNLNINKLRSMPLSAFKPLLELKDFQFYSLQKGSGIEKLEELPVEYNLINLGETFNDFKDTAAAIENLDLVITIDTSIAHLAGAMGKEVWIMTPYHQEWRWFYGLEYSPWYNSARLFKQTQIGTWDGVIETVCENLKTKYFMTHDIKQLLSTGIEHYKNNQLNTAEYYFKKSINTTSSDLAYTSWAVILSIKGEMEKAIELYKKALTINSKNISALTNLSTAYINSNKHDEAIHYLNKAMEINPNGADTYCKLGIIYAQREETDKAIEYYEKAIELDNNYFEAYNNLGKIYADATKIDKAFEYFEKAKNLKPDNFEGYNNLGTVYVQKRMIHEAIDMFKKSLELNPNNKETLFNLGCAYISVKNFHDGWKLYENRLEKDNKTHTPIKTNKPKWDGSDLTGKTIFIATEQGYGDTIQFFRLLSQLSLLKPKQIIFRPRKGLESLLKDSDIKNITIIGSSTPDNQIDFDTYTYLMSLPYLLKLKFNNITHTKKYLNANKAKVFQYKEKYFLNNKTKIGLCWQGNPRPNKFRSMKLNELKKIINMDNIQFYSLQKGLGEEQLGDFEYKDKIIKLGDTFNDYSDTAAAIMNLDIVITIDTSVAHLAGALGKKVLILTPFNQEWRWFNDISYCPWYKSAKIFQQTTLGEWDDVLDKVRVELNSLSKLNYAKL